MERQVERDTLAQINFKWYPAQGAAKQVARNWCKLSDDTAFYKAKINLDNWTNITLIGSRGTQKDESAAQSFRASLTSVYSSFLSFLFKLLNSLLFRQMFIRKRRSGVSLKFLVVLEEVHLFI